MELFPRLILETPVTVTMNVILSHLPTWFHSFTPQVIVFNFLCTIVALGCLQATIMLAAAPGSDKNPWLARFLMGLSLLLNLAGVLLCSIGQLLAGLLLATGHRPLAELFAILPWIDFGLFVGVFVLMFVTLAVSEWLVNQGKPDKVNPQPDSQSMNSSIPPTIPPACDALVSEAAQLPPGTMANKKLIEDTLFAAYAAAGAKRGAQIPQETMIEPHLSKEPQGVRGSMTWEEIWVFQTQPKTAVRITFTEDGKGGADYAIRMN